MLSVRTGTNEAGEALGAAVLWRARRWAEFGIVNIWNRRNYRQLAPTGALTWAAARRSRGRSGNDSWRHDVFLKIPIKEKRDRFYIKEKG